MIRPEPVAGPDFELVQHRGQHASSSAATKPRRWILQTDFSNDEAVGYLADRLARLGVEEALAEAGAAPGAEVLIGEDDNAVVFDWDPERCPPAPASALAAATLASPADATAAPQPPSSRRLRGGRGPGR